MSLKFDFEWEDPGEGVAPELRATWARLCIRVGNQVVTRVEDLQAQSVRSAVHVPLLPLAEWLADHWWHLWHERRGFSNCRAQLLESPPWRRRHCLSGVGDGFVWPSLCLVSDGGRTCASWWDERTARPHSFVRYLEAGAAWLDRDETAEECARLIRSVLSRLEDRRIAADELQEQWRSVMSVDVEERPFCEAAAELGLDPYAVDASTSAVIVAACEGVLPDLFHELAADVDIERLPAEVQWCQQATIVAGARKGVPSWGRLRGDTGTNGAPNGGPPWRIGYSRAERVRRLLRLGEGPLPDDVLGGPSVPEAVVPSTTGRIALGFVRDDAAGVVFGEVSGHPPQARSRTFLRARAMHDLLHLPAPMFLLTRANTREQATGRAFAAELLLPAAAIRTRLRHRLATSDDVADIAAEYSVSELVVRLQIVNHEIPASLD